MDANAGGFGRVGCSVEKENKKGKREEKLCKVHGVCMCVCVGVCVCVFVLVFIWKLE